MHINMCTIKGTKAVREKGLVFIVKVYSIGKKGFIIYKFDILFV